MMNDAPNANASSQTLVLYGSFAAERLRREVADWHRAVVLEVDASLPAAEREKCAAVLTLPPLIPTIDTVRLQERTDALLDQFLQERVRFPGLQTSRRFRAACLNINAHRIVAPHIVCLEYLKRLLNQSAGSWKEVLVSPGAGVSLRAAEQVGRALGVPVRVLPLDREKPPLLWMLRRKWQRARTLRKQKKASGVVPAPPLATGCGGSWCVDSRLFAALAKTDIRGDWVRGPGFTSAELSDLEKLRAEYARWWSAWMQDWRREHSADDLLSDHEIMDDLGQWFSREVYPRHAMLLQQAETAIRAGRPERVLIGSMRGREEMLWGLAAQDAGIPVVVYTVDCHIDTRLCFKPDVALCDDRRQWDIATEHTTLNPEQVVKVHSHRQLEVTSRAQDSHGRARKRILMADSYYSGMVLSSPPLLSSWAIQQTIEAARLMPEYDFVIKFHPIRERPERLFHYSGLHHLHLWHRDRFIQGLKPPSNVSLLPPEARLSDEMADADLLLNIQSYAGLEAFTQDLPVIYVQPLDEEGLYPRMREQGAMQIALTVDRLVELIRLNLTDSVHLHKQLELQRRYLADFYWSGAPSLAQAAMISGCAATSAASSA
jgi:hypothetical protein